MILYTDKALETAINGASKSIIKLAETKPTDDFTSEDIRNAMYYIEQFKNECLSEKHRRERNKLKERRKI